MTELKNPIDRRMTQQVGATSEHQRLGKQLERLRGIEKSEIRMIEADRQRFRMKYRKKDFPKASTLRDAKINDPPVDDDERLANENQKFIDEHDYEAARSLIFTDGKVDLDKILCLHLLTYHVVDIDDSEFQVISHKNGQSPIAEESENDILPRYVVEIQRDEFHKRHDNEEEEEVSQPPEGQLPEGALLARRGMPAPSAAGKMPMLSRPLYDDLLESQKTRRGNSPSLEHLQRYIHTGQMLHKFDEKIADDKPRRVQSSLARRILCKNEKYFVCAEMASAEVSKLPRNQQQWRPILICSNDRLKNFVRTVVDILKNVNREKTNSLTDMLESAEIVAAKLSEMEDFVKSLENFSFVLLPESFTCVPGYAIEDALCDEKKNDKRPVAKTLILESKDISVFDNFLENVRQGISDFWKKPKSEHSKSVDTLLESVSMYSVLSQTNTIANTVTQKSSRASFNVGKPIEKIELSESTAKSSARSYDSIQQEFNEAASARLAKNLKKGSLLTDPDRLILRRMTNSQRILVGQMCAAMKTKKINNEGMAKEKIPLPALLKPVLSRESINYLTQGTIYAKDNGVDATKVESKNEVPCPCVKLTDFMLAKIYHEVFEVESRCQLQHFMNETV